MTSGRPGMGNARYRRNRATMLAVDDLCRICWHPGAATADHVISAADWPRDATGRKLPGFDEPANLQPAHGTMGNDGSINPCPVCGRLCNQSRGTRPMAALSPRSRDW